MKAYYKKLKPSGSYQLLILIDGKIADGGTYITKRDLVNYAKRELGIQDVNKWEKDQWKIKKGN